MQFLHILGVFIYFLTRLNCLVIYINTTKICAINCGFSPNTAFSSLSVAIFVIDQIIDQNPEYISNFSDLSSHYLPNDDIIFNLLPYQSYKFNVAEMNSARPCTQSNSECVFTFFNHSFVTTGSIIFQGVITEYEIEKPQLGIQTRRMIIYANFSYSLKFEYIYFISNLADCSDCSVASPIYGFLMLWPFATNSSRIRDNFPILMINNCTFDNFPLYNTYSYFVGFFSISSQYYHSDYISENQTRYYIYTPTIIFNNSNFIETYAVDALFSIQKAIFIIENTNFSYINNYINVIFKVSSIWISYSELWIKNIVFTKVNKIIDQTYNCSIYFNELTIQGDLTIYGDSLFNFDYYSAITLQSMILKKYNLIYMFVIGDNNLFSLSSTQISDCNISQSLINADAANTITINSSSFAKISNFTAYGFLIKNNNTINFNKVNFSSMSAQQVILQSFFSFSDYNNITMSEILLNDSSSIGSIFLIDNFNNLKLSLLNISNNKNNIRIGSFIILYHQNNVINLHGINISTIYNNSVYFFDHFIELHNGLTNQINITLVSYFTGTKITLPENLFTQSSFFGIPGYDVNLNNNSILNYYLNSTGNLSLCHDNVCSVYCVAGLYPDSNNFCHLCDKTCKLCEKTSNNCVSCNGFYLNDEIQCYSTCPNPYFGNYFNMSCLKSCPLGMAQNSLNNLCEFCSFDCNTCQYSSNNCENCKYDWLLNPPLCLKPNYTTFIDNNIFSSISLTPQDIINSGWIVISPLNQTLTSKCGLFNIFGGFNLFGINTSIFKYYSLSKHFRVRITFFFLKIDEWNNNTLIIKADSHVIFNLTLNKSDDNTTYLCGIKEYSDAIRQIDVIFNHFSQNLSLLITTDISNDSLYWGLFNFSLTIDSCDNTCETCNSFGSTNCTSCSSPYYLETNNTCQICNDILFNFTCIKQCPDNYFEENSRCVTNCSTNYFINNKTCQKCDNSCLTCNQIDCLTCQNSYFLYDGTCNIDCPNSTYKNLTNKICSPCSYSCLNCVGNDNLSCTSCDNKTRNLTNSVVNSEYSKNVGACVCLFSYDNDTQCYSQSECPQNYILDQNGKCQKCDDSCKTCYQSNNNKTCLSCWESFYLYENTCLKECPFSYYKNNDTQTCSKCHFSCEACLGSGNFSCISCDIKTRYQFNFTYNSKYSTSLGFCVCLPSYYGIDNEAYCFPCHYTCKECSGSDSKLCLNCPDTRMMLPSNECPCSAGLIDYHQPMCLDGSKDILIIIIDTSKKTVVYISIIGLLTLPICGLLSIFFKFIEIAQELIMLLYIKSNLPLNFENTLDFLKNYELSYLLPKFFQFSNKTIEILDDKFGYNDISTLFLENAFTLLLISIIIPWILIILVTFLKKCCMKWKLKYPRIHSYFNSFRIYVKYNLMFLLFQNSTQELSMFLALDLKYFSFSETVKIISSVFCLIFLIGNFLMIFWMKNIISKINANPYSEIPEKYISLFDCLDLEKQHSLYFPLIKLIKKFLLSFFIVFLYDYILALFISLCILTILMYLYIRIVEPFENKYRNMISEITEFLQCCLYCLLFLYYQSKVQTQDETGLYIGYISIVILIIIIVLNFSMMIINIFFTCLKMFYKFNKILTEYKLGEKISKKFESIKMREFTYEKYQKDLKTGVWFKRSIFHRKVEKRRDNFTQYEYPPNNEHNLSNKNFKKNLIDKSKKTFDNSLKEIEDMRNNVEMEDFKKDKNIEEIDDDSFRKFKMDGNVVFNEEFENSQINKFKET